MLYNAKLQLNIQVMSPMDVHHNSLYFPEIFYIVTTCKTSYNYENFSRISQNLTQILIVEVNKQKTKRKKPAGSTKFGLSYLGQEMI